MKQKGNDINKYVLIIFLAVTMLYILVYAILGFAPFGEKTVVTWDLKAEYLPFMSYLQRVIKNLDLSFYTQQIVLGGGTIGLLAYFAASPFNFLLVFFDTEQLPLVIMLIILLKHSCSAITMFLFLVERYIKEKENKELTVFALLAIVYAFSGYAVNMQFNLMWLDGMIALPIICMGLERLVKKKKRGVLIFSLWYALVSNFYIGYMLWIFSIVYFLFLLIENKKYKESDIWKKYIQSILGAAGIGMFLILPLLHYLSISKLSGDSTIERILRKGIQFKNEIIAVIFCGIIGFVFRRQIRLIMQKMEEKGRKLKKKYPIIFIIINALLIAVAGVVFWNFLNWGSNKGLFQKKVIYTPLKLFPGAFSESEIVNGLPNIYVGSFVIILLIRYLSEQKSNRRNKALFLMMLGVMFGSMLIRPLNSIWHGFAEPHGSPYRYSFIISFILLTMSAEYVVGCGEKKFERNKRLHCLGIWLLLVGWICISLYKYVDLQSDFLSVKKILTGLFFCIIMLSCMQKYEKKAISYIILFVTCAEMCCNAVWSLNEMNYMEWNSYKKQVQEIQTVVTEIKEYDSGIYRIESPDLEANNALLYDYNGVSHYSSVIPASTVQLFDTFGMKPEFMGDMETLYNSTVKSEEAGLLGIKYIFSEHIPEDKDFKLIFQSGKYGVYQNLSYHEIMNMVPAEKITDNLSDFKKLSQEQLETIIPIKYIENEIMFEIPEYKGEEKRLLLSIAYDKGWQGEMDGHKIEIQKAYDSLLSIDMPEGKHTVVLKYEVPYLKEGILISAVFLISMILLRNHGRRNKMHYGGNKV